MMPQELYLRAQMRIVLDINVCASERIMIANNCDKLSQN